ncbi:DUF1003 domain-containing protein [Candidatus Daviesbacteria bacterium]|nr:DUF1003 domain-containing protein [Candidatus Daviesbacteria bacterium]
MQNEETKPQTPNAHSQQGSHHHSNTERRRQFFKSFEAKSLRSRSLLTQLSDDLTEICGSTPFLIFHILLFVGWVILNTNIIPGTVPFDPFPFGLLTMVVSLEAIFLSIFVLVSQNRSSYINSLREEVHLRVNLIAEEEITKVLEVLAELRKEMGIKKKDEELEEMLKRIDTNYIERSILGQIDRAKPSLAKKLYEEFPEIFLYPVRKPIEIVQNIANSSNGNSGSNKPH